jgi:hypothetical protein
VRRYRGRGAAGTELIQLNTIVFTAMPTATMRTAVIVNQGLRRRSRNANQKSFIVEGIVMTRCATRVPIRSPCKNEI